MTAADFLGTGVPFPLRPDPTGRVPFVRGDDVVRTSIESILDTEPGERIMRPDYGCGLRRYLMEPNTTATRASMRGDIETALTTWEPRIRLTNVAVTPGEEPSLVWIEISYERAGDRREDNLIYPFYLQ